MVDQFLYKAVRGAYLNIMTMTVAKYLNYLKRYEAVYLSKHSKVDTSTPVPIHEDLVKTLQECSAQS